MRDRFALLADKLRTSLWAVPMALLVLAALLFETSMGIDRLQPAPALLRQWGLHSGTGDDARNLLSTLLGAIITMSSVVFSITIVALSLAAAQFGSRMVRAYVSDSRTKLALGLFTMTIFYCLLALRAVGGAMPVEQVPHVTVSVGLLLAVVCILVLLLFLHVVARSIIADDVVRRVADELQADIAALPDLRDWQAAEQPADLLPPEIGERPAVVLAARAGYIQAIGFEQLARSAEAADVVVRMDVHAGEYVAAGGWLAAVHPRERATPELLATLREAVFIGHQRTPTQDLEFSFRYLVDVALRALSPGINDAHTAIVVIDHLRGALSLLVGKALATPVLRDAEGRVRVVGQPLTHGDVMHAALDNIRHAAAPHPTVVVSLVAALGHVLEHARWPQQWELIARQAELVAETALLHPQHAHDRAAVEEALAKMRGKLARCKRGHQLAEERPAG